MAIRLAALLLIGAACGSLPHAALAQSGDPMDGRVVREIRVSGLRNVPADVVQRHLATRAGEPFRRATLTLDKRRLDELRLFTSVIVEPRLENDAVILEVAVTETLRLLPVVILRVTDENGVSAGPGLRGINLLGRGTQVGVSVRFGGETGVAATVDATTITPGTWAQHLGFSYTDRQNTLYDFDERATSADARFARNWNHGLRAGAGAELLVIDTGTSGAALSPDGTDVIPTLGAFVTVDTLDSSTNPRRGWWGEAKSIDCSGTRGRGRSSWTDGDSSRSRIVTVWACSGSPPSRQARSARICRSICSLRWAAPTACAVGASVRRTAGTSSSARLNTRTCCNRFERSPWPG